MTAPLTTPLVLVDADVLGRHRTGDETYVANLLAELPRLAPELRLAALTRHPELVPAGIEPVHVPARSQITRMTLRLRRALARLTPDVAHFQYVAPPAWRGPTILTVHDLSFEHEPRLFRPRDRTLLRTLVPRAVDRADHVLTVSEWTRRDLVERYGLPETKVTAAHNGVSPVFHPDGHVPDRRPYMLFVGALQPRKDPVSVVEALALLVPDTDLDLLMVGPDRGAGGRVRRTAERLGVAARVEVKGHVPLDELAALYRGATCFVLPSRWEGFGLPVVEAMASGTPVVTTTAAALPEIVGDAGILVPAGDPAALAGGIRDALADRERLVAAGLKRASSFRWAATAEKTLAVYRHVLTARRAARGGARRTARGGAQRDTERKRRTP